jgi:hypothetical protein
MGIVRIVMLTCMAAGMVCFLLYRWTGQPRWRTRGLQVVLGTLGAVMAFATWLWWGSA